MYNVLERHRMSSKNTPPESIYGSVFVPGTRNAFHKVKSAIKVLLFQKISNEFHVPRSTVLEIVSSPVGSAMCVCVCVWPVPPACSGSSPVGSAAGRAPPGGRRTATGTLSERWASVSLIGT